MISDYMKMQNNDQFIIPGRFHVIDYARTSLWRDLAMWTRAYLTSACQDQEYQDAIFNRLYSIPLNFGHIFSILFGRNAARQYITLLSQFIAILQAIINAMQNDDRDAVNENTVRLYKNADARIAFLCESNPYWQPDIWLSYMYTYLDLTLNEISTYFEKDYESNIRIFDNIMYHTTLMGDYFAEGFFRHIY